MDIQMSLTTEQIVDYLHENVNLEERLGVDDALFSSGMLDSVTMMNLIMFIEENCRFQIQPYDVTLDNFDSVSKIHGFIHEQA